MNALKKPQCPPVKKTLAIVEKTTEATILKAEIERMKQLVTEKIKDPQVAKKAAQIISEMLNSKD